MLPFDLVRGCNNYTGLDNIKLKSGSYSDAVPEIVFYSSLNVTDTAHYAMKVGSVEQYYCWIFKTHWDIIVHWNRNYNSDSNGYPTSIYTSYQNSYYVVDQQYRQSAYQLFDGNTLIR